MSSEERIGYHEALTLLVITLSAKIYLSFPRNMALLGDAAGWIIVFLSGIYSLIGYFFLSSLLRKYPGKNIIQISHQLGGSIIGKVIGLGFFLFFLAITSLYLRQFAESFILAILPRTPISVLTIFFLVLLIYAALLGIETLSRVAWLLGPYLLTALIIILFFSLPQASFNYLTPVLGPGAGPLLKYSVANLPIFAEIILLGIIAPLMRDRNRINRMGVISLLVAMTINVGITILTIAVFNYAAVQKMIFPIFQLTRLISYGEFIQRVEAVFVFLWFFWAGIQLGGLFYGTVTSFAQNFRIKNYRPLTFPIAVLVFTLSLIPNSMTEAVELNDYVFKPSLLGIYYAAAAFGLPFLLWLIMLFKKHSGGANE
ncbi:MAG: GerAB/ArcD/ProY family transporter [Bacteroidota bacterium]